MKETFHEGEIAVQKRAGVEKMAARVGQSIGSTIPALAKDFVHRQPLAVAATVDKKGRVWASILTGKTGFMRAIDDETLEIETGFFENDLLFENLRANEQIGLLAIEFETRRRMRLNGSAELKENSIIVRAEQVYSNCPKYIQARVWEFENDELKDRQISGRTNELSEMQQNFIGQADTFFIASHHRTGGADASHRGGNHGFVGVLDEKTLVFPDYSGNMMFQTLGNLAQNPNSGLLFVDFETGTVLQMSGTAKIIWDEKVFGRLTGAERAVEFHIEEIIETKNAIALKWDFLESSPFNPK